MIFVAAYFSRELRRVSEVVVSADLNENSDKKTVEASTGDLSGTKAGAKGVRRKLTAKLDQTANESRPRAKAAPRKASPKLASQKKARTSAARNSDTDSRKNPLRGSRRNLKRPLSHQAGPVLSQVEIWLMAAIGTLAALFLLPRIFGKSVLEPSGVPADGISEPVNGHSPFDLDFLSAP